MTADETAVVMKKTLDEIEAGGLWAKMCASCGRNIGGRLACYGKPTEEDLKRCACPGCGAVGQATLEFVPPRTKES